MSEVDRIREQLRRAVHGEAWHGAALLELLEGVSARQAAARPLAKAHGIWEIVHHLSAWATIVRRRLEETGKIEITAEVDWPPVGATGKRAWDGARQALEAAHAGLDRALGKLDQRALSRPARGSTTTPYVLAHGVIQHGLYHGGQIALLKKAQ